MPNNLTLYSWFSVSPNPHQKFFTVDGDLKWVNIQKIGD